MSENYSFRSAMGGFNRNDVIAYIERILCEKNGLSAEIQSLQNCISEMENEINRLKKEKESLTAELNEAKAQIASQNKCEDCDISRKYEAHLGAAMLDAKRFSDTLVKEANDKAYDIFDEAYKKADATLIDTAKISSEITELNAQFNRYFKLLLDNTKSLEKSLDGFKTEVRSSKRPFATDNKAFKETLSASSQKTEASQKEVFRKHREINFDDADEYDIKVDM